MLSSVLVPFIKLEPPFQELKDVIEAVWEPWAEYGKNRERVGELMQRVGLGNFLEAIDVEPLPQMVAHPRDNPYVFYEDYYEEGDEDEEEDDNTHFDFLVVGAGSGEGGVGGGIVVVTGVGRDLGGVDEGRQVGVVDVDDERGASPALLLTSCLRAKPHATSVPRGRS